jgi:hypothetical protein
MKKRIALILLALFCISSVFSVNKNEQSDKKSKMVISGYVISKGSMPFTMPAIKSEDGKEYLISCSAKTGKKLLKLQGYKIKFTGYLEEDLFILKKYKKIK